ncbi:MAG: hypothetical protein M5R36_25590 [Deltaproteobacteria bacterium]|nr:hypothetical protein [Deltaproteobacteria bacterium]
MRRMWPVLAAVLILLAAGGVARAEWVSLGGEAGAAPAIDVLSATPDGIAVRVALPGFEFGSQDGFDTLTIPTPLLSARSALRRFPRFANSFSFRRKAVLPHVWWMPISRSSTVIPFIRSRIW